MTPRYSLLPTLLPLAAATGLFLATAASLPAQTKSAAERERELIAILKSDAPAAEKAITCKHLAVYGSAEAVPELAKLLPDERFSSWARIALEAIPGEASNAALRASLASLPTRQLIGAINSLGVRKDAGAVELLTARLQDKEADVASAAAVALGQIATPPATKSLRAALATVPAAVRSAVAEGCVLCAERCVAEGRQAEAREIYDEVRKAAVPKQRVLEATRGAILASKQDGIPLLVEQLRATDKAFFQIGLSAAREMSGKQVDEALAAELSTAATDRAALIISAMADRKPTVVIAALQKAAASGPSAVRVAAINALGQVGDASNLSLLLDAAQESDAAVQQAAKSALADLPGENLNAEIAARLGKADGKMYRLLLELVGLRRIDALPQLQKALDSSDPAIRAAALNALGNTIPADRLSLLISQVVSPKNPADTDAAQQALLTAAIRMPDREACATELAAAFNKASAATKATLLTTIAAVGGTKSLQVVGEAAKSSDPTLQDVSSRLLGEWATIDAAPVLLDLTKSAPGEKFQLRALRGYIRIARQFVMPDPQRVTMCQNAMAAAKQPADQKAVLEVLKRYPSPGTLKLAVDAASSPSLKDDATAAALVIAQKVGAKGGKVGDIVAKLNLEKVTLEIVKAEYGSGSTQKDVTSLIKKFANGSAMISLSGNFNDVLGGDPAPGAVKQLRIQYRMNGKAGDASFAENTLIILPMPK